MSSHTPNSYTYRHLAAVEQHALSDLRERTRLLDSTYVGSLLLTVSEYCLFLPILNTVVMYWNTQHYRQMARFSRLSDQSRSAMLHNLVLASAVGFVPVFNVIWSRKFKCNTRNLDILEAQLQSEENRYLYGREDTPDCVPLPKHIDRLFSRCPVYQRNQAGDSESKLDVTTINVAEHDNNASGNSSSVNLTLTDTRADEHIHDSHTKESDGNMPGTLPSGLAKSSEPATSIAVDIGDTVAAGTATSGESQTQQPTAASSWLYLPVNYMYSLIWGSPQHAPSSTT